MRGAPAQHFNLSHRFARHTIPVNPTSEWIVKWNPVGQHDRAARSAGAKAAQRNALGSWIRGPAAAATKQTEAGHLAQCVVKRDRGRCLEIFRTQHRNAGRSFPDASVRAGCGDGYSFGD